MWEGGAASRRGNWSKKLKDHVLSHKHKIERVSKGYGKTIISKPASNDILSSVRQYYPNFPIN